MKKPSNLHWVKKTPPPAPDASPTKKGNVMCMDCRCGGKGCPGMPPGYEANLIKDWSA